MTVTPSSTTGEKTCALPGTPGSYADVVERLFAGSPSALGSDGRGGDTPGDLAR